MMGMTEHIHTFVLAGSHESHYAQCSGCPEKLNHGSGAVCGSKTKVTRAIKCHSLGISLTDRKD